MITNLSSIVSDRRVVIFCDALKTYTEVLNISKRRGLKIEIYPSIPLEEELIHHDIIIVIKKKHKKELKKNRVTKLYTYPTSEPRFLLDLVSALKGEFIKSIDIGMDPGLYNIGIAVIADGILVMGETVPDADTAMNILKELLTYDPPVKRVKLKIGNGENYRLLLQKITQLGSKILGEKGEVKMELVDEYYAKRQVLAVDFLKDKNVIAALKILLSKSYKELR